MDSQTKNCQNCKKDFIIEPDDFAFYEKMKVPAPTFCPDCRLQRRFAFRNERTMYKRPCSLCGKDVITIYSPNGGTESYCSPCWWSDKWDPMDYGIEYDFSRPFFTQFSELMRKVPHQNLAILYSSVVNTEFANMAHELKNCYYLFNSDYNENCMYSEELEHSKECIDTTMVESSQLVYDSLNCTKCYQIYYSVDCENSNNIWFSKNLVGCSECFCCMNLRNKKYHIFNESYSTEEYFEKIKEYKLNSYTAVRDFKKQVKDFWLKFSNKHIHGIKNIDSTGDYIHNSKNIKNSFLTLESENCKHCTWLLLGGNKDCYDFTQGGQNAQLIYETLVCGINASNIIGSREIIEGCDITYSMFCPSNNNNLFGCYGLRNKQYCIFNKQYTKEEYEDLVPKIIEHMNAMPYVDKVGRVYKYGEFFPTEISLFSYNETSAQEFFPLTKEEAKEQGYPWKDQKDKNYKITIESKDLPDSILTVKDDIASQIIECEHGGNCKEQCTTAFRITQQELQFYRSQNIPLPHLCPNCRHYQRVRSCNPLKLWHRKCMRIGCQNEFETSYAPDRPEIVYCESCYNQEVA